MRIVLVGTGTGIGKTHFGVTLVSALRDRGEQVCGLKPIESGVPQGHVGEDARALAEVSSFHVKHPQPYALPDAVSPHLAARRAGVAIDLASVVRWVDEHTTPRVDEHTTPRVDEHTAPQADEHTAPRVDEHTAPQADERTAPWVIVETAGALLSPIAPGVTNLDLAVALRPDAWILIAPDRLGVLHDVAAASLALGALCSPPVRPTVVLQTPATPDTATGTNADELVHLGVVPRAFTLPWAPPTDPRCRAVALQVVASFPQAGS